MSACLCTNLQPARGTLEGGAVCVGGVCVWVCNICYDSDLGVCQRIHNLVLIKVKLPVAVLCEQHTHPNDSTNTSTGGQLHCLPAHAPHSPHVEACQSHVPVAHAVPPGPQRKDPSASERHPIHRHPQKENERVLC